MFGVLAGLWLITPLGAALWGGMLGTGTVRSVVPVCAGVLGTGVFAALLLADGSAEESNAVAAVIGYGFILTALLAAAYGVGTLLRSASTPIRFFVGGVSLAVVVFANGAAALFIGLWTICTGDEGCFG